MKNLIHDINKAMRAPEAYEAIKEYVGYNNVEDLWDTFNPYIFHDVVDLIKAQT